MRKAAWLLILVLSLAAFLPPRAAARAEDASASLSGGGTPDSPFLIGTAADLRYMRDQVNAGGTVAPKGGGDPVPARTSYYLQTADIALGYWRDDGDGVVEAGEIYPEAAGGPKAAAGNWTPIGTAERPFSGSYDGKGRTVSGLYINEDSLDGAGLFGVLSGAGRVENLGITDSYIQAASSVGGVAGIVRPGGTLGNCYYAGSVRGSGAFVGGVAGNNGGTVVNCYHVGAVGGSAVNVGGVAGSNSGTVANCYHTGSVGGNGVMGGVAGDNSGTVGDCYNAGSVSGSGDLSGGVIGNNSGSVSGCLYDSQMCILAHGIGGEPPSIAAEGVLTAALAAGSPVDGWDAEAWVFTENLYPRLRGLDTTAAAQVSASPVFLSGADTADSVMADFTLSTSNGVAWASSDTDAVSLSGGSAHIGRSGGNVALKAVKDGVTRTVLLKSVTKPVAAFTGTASLAGTAAFGQTLAASLSGGSNTGALSYQWMRNAADIPGANDSIYTLAEADIGAVIAVRISSGAEAGSATSEPTALVQKAECAISPVLDPVLESRAADGITLRQVPGYEYLLAADSADIATGTWQDGNSFTGLAANTPYDAWQRVKETAARKPSALSAKLDVKTADALVPGILQWPARDFQITARGPFGRDAVLTASVLPPGSGDRAALETLLRGTRALAAYEISVAPEDAFALPLILSFRVDEKYSGHNIVILHRLKDGDVESFTPTVRDGWVSVQATELSLFLLAAEPGVKITLQPQNTTVSAGAGAAFQVEAAGFALTYQWQRSVSGGAAWQDIFGAKGDSFETAPVNQGNSGCQYRVLVRDGYGGSETSRAATLTVTAASDTEDGSMPGLYAAAVVALMALALIRLAGGSAPGPRPRGSAPGPRQRLRS